MPLCETWNFFQVKTRVPRQQQQQNMVQRQSDASIGSNYSTTPLLTHSSSGDWGEEDVLRGKLITRRRGAIKHQRYQLQTVLIYSQITMYLIIVKVQHRWERVMWFGTKPILSFSKFSFDLENYNRKHT